jgi:flagellar biosynthetic protein FlhB
LASLFDQAGEERTEAATPYRREEFRRQGIVALSREIASVALLLGVGIFLMVSAGPMHREFSALVQRFFSFSGPSDLNAAGVLEVQKLALGSWASMVLPIFAVAVAVGGLACLAQVGWYPTWEPLVPNWDRLNPATGAQRLFSLQGTLEALKALLKFTMVGVVLWFFLRSHLGEIASTAGKTVPELSAVMWATVGKAFLCLCLALSVLAAGDFAIQRSLLEKRLRMTRREAKDEFKLREGDPLIKSRIRQRQRRIIVRRMMDAVPKADVVITHPAEFSVALQYDSTRMESPRVVAKGVDRIARRLEQLAVFHRVPLVENKALARTLCRELEVGQSVPPDLFKDVAQILAQVYRLKGVGPEGSGNDA